MTEMITNLHNKIIKLVFRLFTSRDNNPAAHLLYSWILQKSKTICIYIVSLTRAFIHQTGV